MIVGVARERRRCICHDVGRLEVGTVVVGVATGEGDGGAVDRECCCPYLHALADGRVPAELALVEADAVCRAREPRLVDHKAAADGEGAGDLGGARSEEGEDAALKSDGGRACDQCSALRLVAEEKEPLDEDIAAATNLEAVGAGEWLARTGKHGEGEQGILFVNAGRFARVERREFAQFGIGCIHNAEVGQSLDDHILLQRALEVERARRAQ